MCYERYKKSGVIGKSEWDFVYRDKKMYFEKKFSGLSDNIKKW